MRINNLQIPDNGRVLNTNILMSENDNVENKNVSGDRNVIQAIKKTLQNNNGLAKRNKDLDELNMIIGNNISSRYIIIQYLGKGIHGDLYLVEDANNRKRKMILKRIKLQANENKIQEQLNFELKILKYLSSNRTTREYINPCIDYKIVNDEAFTLFPVFNGYSLNYLEHFIRKLSHEKYYKIVFYLIKAFFHGLGKIHKSNISHQNIRETSILISTFANPHEMKVKFTDFGLGCGNSEMDKPLISIDDYDKHINGSMTEATIIGKCSSYLNIPIKIDKTIIDKLTDKDYLNISQNYDIFCLGLICLKLLLWFELDDITEYYTGYNNYFINNLQKKIIEKYIKKSLPPFVSVSPKLSINNKGNNFAFINIRNDTRESILEYLKLLNSLVFCNTHNRKKCQYILDKIILYEKYKNDIM